MGAAQPELPRSVGRWIQHPQEEIWFHTLFFGAVTVLLVLVLALGFILSNKIDSFLFTYLQVHACALGIVLGQVGLVSSAGPVSNCPVPRQEITLL